MLWGWSNVRTVCLCMPGAQPIVIEYLLWKNSRSYKSHKLSGLYESTMGLMMTSEMQPFDLLFPWANQLYYYVCPDEVIETVEPILEFKFSYVSTTKPEITTFKILRRVRWGDAEWKKLNFFFILTIYHTSLSLAPGSNFYIVTGTSTKTIKTQAISSKSYS